ncbi:Adaptin N terminal region family protein [Histomonas meleagridis]|uniref:Adaptin N terminal region family protein n=1 Tax=Histomonas meleagridis TaxID=135588 RepID=UPI00355A8BC3|nr:Adaptin N terminal region family protein [Histomonas meleagridis]KAH0799064.1 Adaptin N terminal region family protein [Histomonas meleagridis]
MSALGSVGSSDYQEETGQSSNLSIQSLPLGSGDSPETQREQTIQTINKLFQASGIKNQTIAIKMLLAMMSKGHDVGEFVPTVIPLVASPDLQLRHLCHIFLAHYADGGTEAFTLCVNTFQKSLTDTDPIIRATSLKILSSFNHKEILPVIQDAVNQVIGDPSPYVKKEVAFAIIKAAELDPNEIENYIPLIERIMKDQHPISFSGAIAAYWSLCPDNIKMLHPHFKFICTNITRFDEFAQVFIIRSMTLYTRYCFKNPETQTEDEANESFWDDNAAKETISSDHLLLVSSIKKLLNSLNPAVVLAAASYLYYCAPSTHVSSIARPLVRLLYEEPLVEELVLSAILTFAQSYHHIFIPHLNHFYVRKNDSPKVKSLKLELLSLLASHSSADNIMKELAFYTSSSDTEFAANAVKTMGKAAMCNPEIIPVCLITLLKLMDRSDGKVLEEVVLVIAHILRLKRGTDDEAHSLKHLCQKFIKIKSPDARSAVLSIVGDMHETHPEFAPQLLRYIAKNFKEEPDEVRLQSLVLAAKLIVCGTESKIPMYLLKISEHDIEFDVRDRAKLLVTLLETKSKCIQSKLKELLFPKRKTPNWFENEFSNYQVGTFSHFFNKEISGYEPLPDWLPEDELPDESVRHPVQTLPSGNKIIVVKVNGSQKVKDDDDMDIEHFFSDDDEEVEEEEDGEVEIQKEDDEAEYYEYEEEIIEEADEDDVEKFLS